ncbi:MAG: type II toxin-antitoxin system VapC family toxin [Stellaceae bacterium]
MTLYLDTSLLVTALTSEPETVRMQGWLAQHEADGFAISGWVITEFSSALSVKMRTQQITRDHRAAALATFARLCAESFAILPVSDVEFRAAALFADQHAVGVRAGDALHLAICAAHSITLCTLDRRLSEGGKAFGVETRLV